MSIYGFKANKLNGSTENIVKIVKSGSTITKGDPISLEDDRAIVTTAALPIFGTYQGEDAIVGDGVLTVSILCGADIEYIIDNDNDTNTFAGAGYGAGKAYNIIGTTGAILVDTSSASATTATLNLICIDETPDAGDASLGTFKVNKANTQY